LSPGPTWKIRGSTLAGSSRLGAVNVVAGPSVDARLGVKLTPRLLPAASAASAGDSIIRLVGAAIR
jgi:hypothetical protein